MYRFRPESANSPEYPSSLSAAEIVAAGGGRGGNGASAILALTGTPAYLEAGGNNILLVTCTADTHLYLPVASDGDWFIVYHDNDEHVLFLHANENNYVAMARQSSAFVKYTAMGGWLLVSYYLVPNSWTGA